MHDDIKNWLSYLKSGEDNKIVEGIRNKTKAGQPYGEDGFMIKLEKKLGMELRKKKVGRPRKVKLQQVVKK